MHQKGEKVPEHLFPLICRQGKPYSFLSAVLFDERKYSQCGFTGTERILKNDSYIRRRFVEYYFPDIGPDNIRKIMRLEYPDTMGLLNQAFVQPSLQAKFLYILFHFEEAIKETISIITWVREEMEKQHRQFVKQNEEALQRIQKAPTIEKLKAISGVAPVNTHILFSLSLLEEEKLSFRKDEPDFFILGSRFMDVLETQYKYCNLTPVSFLRALGNEAKCVIFEALMDSDSMSTAEMERRLHLSKNAISRNIKEMRECGVVTVERREGLSYYYALNREYIGIVADQLNRRKHQRKDIKTAEGR